MASASPTSVAPAASTASPETAGNAPTNNNSSKVARILENDPARTGYDPSINWWMNYFRILTGQVTYEGVHHYREDRYREHEKRDCERCESYRDWLFANSPTVRFMREKIETLNGRLDETNVVCRRCPAHIREDGSIARQTGGFSPHHGILLCANEIKDRSHLEDTLSHEMVHAWDHLRWKMDWVGDKQLRHAACTEIRASMLSGECRWSKESFTRGNWNLTQQFQNCVRRRAVQSLLARPACKDDVHAVKVVNEVWDSCFRDTRPFNEVYR